MGKNTYAMQNSSVIQSLRRKGKLSLNSQNHLATYVFSVNSHKVDTVQKNEQTDAVRRKSITMSAVDQVYNLQTQMGIIQ